MSEPVKMPDVKLAETPLPKSLTPPKPNLSVGGPVRGLIPQTIEEAARLAAAMTASKMVPESMQGNDAEETRSRCLMVILSGMEIGSPPMASMTGFYIVNNKVTIYGDLALAVVQSSEHYEWHEEVMVGKEGTPEWAAICTIKRRGVDKPFIRTFSWADAKTAGLIGKRGPWTNYPRRQLQMRARSWAMRDGFSDVLKGMGIAEEVGDIPQKETVKQDVATQADDFAVAAIAHQPAATVDFSTLKEKEKALLAESAALQRDTAQTEPADTEPPQDRGKPACETCGDRRVIEDDSGKGPCPDCQGKLL